VLSGAGVQTTILNNIPYALGLVDSSGLIVGVNRAWEQFRFLNPVCPLASELGGNFLDRIRESSGEIIELEQYSTIDELIGDINKILIGAREEIEFSYCCRGPRGKRWYVCNIVSTLKSGEPEIVGGVVGLREITTQRIYQERLKTEKALSDEESHRKTLFLANLSHELRTPLNAILGFSDLLRSQACGEIPNTRYLQFAENIHEGAEHLQHVVDRILSLAKLHSGHAVLDKELIQVDQLVAKAMRFIEPQFPGRTILVDVEGAVADCRILCDETLIVQVIINLVGNALKYSLSDTDVWLEIRDSGEGELVITVRDWGMGMDPEDIEKARQPFGQVHGSNDHGNGLGLGLPFSIGVVEMHGGVLTIRSRRNYGTTVNAIIPNLRKDRDVELLANGTQ